MSAVSDSRYGPSQRADADEPSSGQWFQTETGLHQNWHRDYDPTLGRYLQADPLGLIDGPSVYGYAKQSPMTYIDPDGLIGKKPFINWVFAAVFRACVGFVSMVSSPRAQSLRQQFLLASRTPRTEWISQTTGLRNNKVRSRLSSNSHQSLVLHDQSPLRFAQVILFGP